MAKSSGASVLTLQVFLRRNFDDSYYERALDRLAPERAALLRGIVLPVNWYPTDVYVEALHAVHEITGSSPDFWERYGAFAADYQINFFSKFVLRFASPLFFLNRGTRLWSRAHDSGRWEVEGGDKRMRGTLREFAVVDPDYCRLLVAWIHRASQLTGTKGQTVHTECRARGGAACVFEGSWE